MRIAREAGETALWPPILATRGPGSSSSLHAHHGLHFIICRAGTLRVRASARGRARVGPGVLTAADVAHAVDATGVEILLLFVDPESDAGRALTTVLERPIRLLDERQRAELAGADPLALMRGGGAEWIARAIEVLGGPAAPPRAAPDARVRRAVKILQGGGDASLVRLAEAVGLSSGRLMHAFTESMGIPLRPYVAWLRLQRAAGAIVRGERLADAAHEAGFADAAHMSRTFRRMLGIPPSQLR
jgi:AraC-like DNA-binding protein